MIAAVIITISSSLTIRFTLLAGLRIFLGTI